MRQSSARDDEADRRDDAARFATCRTRRFDVRPGASQSHRNGRFNAASIMVTPNSTIALSLISHTNAGKTTLARTLLGRDVGTVRDAQHVTQDVTSHVLIETAEGDTLALSDTPGFGDSARLARRLAQEGSPIGWFLSQAWDRFRDRAFYLSQQAVRNVRDEADVVLYLVNASEMPADAGYLAPELRVLEWIAKPVIVLLNQTGEPRPREEEQADEARWRAAFGARPMVRAVVTLDAFARCWVQEIILFDLIGAALPEERQASYRRLIASWQAKRVAQFDDAMETLAEPIAQAACDREPLPDVGLGTVLREIGRGLGLGKGDEDKSKARAAKALASRGDAAIRTATDRLIAIYGLGGRARSEVLGRIEASVTLDAPMSEGKAAMMGGVASGAISGLAADLASGGLTFGAGMLTGAVLGALGGAGIARGMNLARGAKGATLRWDDAFLSTLIVALVLRYLAVAHYGRGRGDWVETEYPPFWQPLVAGVVGARQSAFASVWKQRDTVREPLLLQAPLQQLVGDVTKDVLDRLYPEARVLR
jgi:GTPase Era involved in 16S rRNA processing